MSHTITEQLTRKSIAKSVMESLRELYGYSTNETNDLVERALKNLTPQMLVSLANANGLTVNSILTELPKKERLEVLQIEKDLLDYQKENNVSIVALGFDRRSIALNVGSGLETYALKKEKLTKRCGYVISIQSFSGFYSNQLILYLLMQFPNIEFIDVEALSRLGRNDTEFKRVIDYSRKRLVNILVNGQSIMFGISNIGSGIVMSLSEMELAQKQTSMSKYLYEIVECHLKLRVFESLSFEAQKGFLLSYQSNSRRTYLVNALDLATDSKKAHTDTWEYTEKEITKTRSEEYIHSVTRILELEESILEVND